MFTPCMPGRAVCAFLALTSVFALAPARAQQPAPPPAAAQPGAAPKVAPKTPQKPQPAPAPQQTQTPAPAEQETVVYSPWTKICPKEQPQPGEKEVCITLREARLETGQFVVGAALMERQGDATKMLRLMLPLGMQLIQGARFTVDVGEPIGLPYVVCVPERCFAQREVDADVVAKLKKGQQLIVQGINLPGQVVSYRLSLVDFAKVNEGPPTDPNLIAQRQKEFEDQLRRRTEGAHK